MTKPPLASAAGRRTGGSRLPVSALALALSAAGLLCLTSVPSAGASPQARDTPVAERPLAHQALDLEREAGFDIPAPLYAALDEALDAAEAALPRLTPAGFRTLGRRRARKLLKKVDRAFADLCPVRGKASDGLFGTALREGRCDCDTYTVLYLSLAERVGLPLKATLAPKHMMLLWQGDPDAFYWETTSAEAQDEAFYREWLRPAETSVASGTYLRPLNSAEMTGYLYFLRGTRLRDLKRLEAARRDLERALDHYPALPYAKHVLAATHAEQGDHARAIGLFTEALGMDPLFAKALYRRAGSYYLAGQYAQALADYDRFLALEGPTADALLGRAQSLQAQGFYEAAMAAYNRALDLDDWANARVSRGTLHLLMKKYRRAAKDFTKAVRLSAEQHQAYLLRAHAYELAGRRDRALADVRLFLQRAQESGAFSHLLPSAHELLARLRGAGPDVAALQE